MSLILHIKDKLRINYNLLEKACCGRSPRYLSMKDLLYKLRWMGEDGWREFFLFLLYTGISVIVQSLLFWAGDLPFLRNFHLWGLGCGIIPDVIFLGFILCLTLGILANVNTYPVVPTSLPSIPKWIPVALIILSLIAVYISTMFYYQWWILVWGLVMLAICNWYLAEYCLGAVGRLDLATGIGLICAIGAYFALLITGREPVIDTAGIVTLIVAAFGGWMYSALDI